MWLAVHPAVCKAAVAHPHSSTAGNLSPTALTIMSRYNHLHFGMDVPTSIRPSLGWMPRRRRLGRFCTHMSIRVPNQYVSQEEQL